MPLPLYDYKNTYQIDQCNNIFDSTTTISGNYDQCSQHAFVNNSPFFILTGLNFEESTVDYSNSKCIIPYGNVSLDIIQEWISDLSECTTDKCYTISNDIYYYGVNNNYSLYQSPLLEAPNSTPEISLNEFTQDFSNLTIYLNELSNNFTIYKKEWYDKVIIIKQQNGISGIGYTTEDRKPPNSTSYDKSLYKVKKNLYGLYSQEANLESYLYQNRIKYNNYKDRLTIINNQLSNSQKFFNTLMNKNSGALGALDDSIYNTNVSIIENIILILVALISIYIYFKYIIN